MNVFDDADSATGTADMPTAEALAAMPHDELAVLKTRAERRQVELSGLLWSKRGQARVRVERTVSWYKTLISLCHEACSMQKASRRSAHDERVRQREANYECCFVAVAKEHLSRDSFDRLHNLAEMRTKHVL